MASSKLRVVQIGTDILPCPPRLGGAIESYVFGISKELAKIGLEVHVVTLGENEREYEDDGVIFHQFSLNNVASSLSALFSLFSNPNRNVPYITLKILRILRKIMRDYGSIDVIHAHYFTTCIAPVIYRWVHGKDIKLILHWHNEPKSNKINKWIARQYNLLAAVSQYVRESLIKNLEVRENKVKVIYNAVDTGFYKFYPEYREELRRKLEIGSNTFVLLFVGRIVPEKGLHHLIRALPEVIKRIGNVKLLIVGPAGHFDREIKGSYYAYVMELIKNFKVEKHILHLGRITKEELLKAYCGSDVVVVPSLWQDPCPSVVLEAMACQRPVVAYSVGGIPEIIQHGETGYLVQLLSVRERLSDVLIKVFDNRYALSAIGLKARKEVEKSFSLNVTARRVRDAYLAAFHE